ncbi:MAG: DUF1134 domain-containing protein [Hyphomicrobium sp.]|nr:DUF1134 domain-containing protein [Hyphomicrobium sp.]
MMNGLTSRATRSFIGRVAALLASLALPAFAVEAADDAYRPPADPGYSSGGVYQSPPPPTAETYEPYRPGGAVTPPYREDANRPLDGSRRGESYGNGQSSGGNGGYGEPYAPPSDRASREERYEPVAPADQGGPPETASRGVYTQNEILRAGHGFFGNVSSGMASAIEWAFQKAGRPNGYILGQDAGGAIVAGLRYGEGRLHTKDAGDHKVYWQGPSVGYDFGGEGSKVMVLVYNLRDPSEIYNRFGGVQGAAYVVGGVGVQLQKAGDVTLAPIRAGVGLRLGANVGYLKYTRNPTWNPF